MACRMQERYVNRRAYVSYSYVCLYMHEILLPPPFVHTHLITHTQCSAVIARTPTSHIFTRIRLFLYNMYINTHILVLNTCAQTPTLNYIYFSELVRLHVYTQTHMRASYKAERSESLTRTAFSRVEIIQSCTSHTHTRTPT